jgi:hypothetical protein
MGSHVKDYRLERAVRDGSLSSAGETERGIPLFFYTGLIQGRYSVRELYLSLPDGNGITVEMSMEQECLTACDRAGRDGELVTVLFGAYASKDRWDNELTLKAIEIAIGGKTYRRA